MLIYTHVQWSTNVYCTKALQWSSTIMLFMTLHTRVEHTVILNREQGGWAHFYKQRNKWTERVSKTSNSIQQYEQLVFTKNCQVLRIRIQMNNSHPDPTICLSSKSQALEQKSLISSNVDPGATMFQLASATLALPFQVLDTIPHLLILLTFQC